MTTVATTQPARASTRAPGFTAVLASEWTKMRSQRSFYIEVALILVLTFGMTALISSGIGSGFDQQSAEEQATFDPVFMSFFGTAFASIVMIVLGVTSVSSEYTSGMIRTTLTATPRRRRVLLAKATLVGLVTVLLGFVTSFGAFFVAQTILDSYGAPSATLSDGEALRAVTAASFTAAFWPLMGAAIAELLRNTAAAITTTIASMLLPAILGEALPDAWQSNVMRFFPIHAEDSLIMTNPEPGTLTHSEPAVAVAILLAWLIGFYALAFLSLAKRDV